MAKHEYKVRAYNLDYKPGETDLQYYKRLAKVADQRLVRLEQLSASDENYKAATSYAYAKAMRDLEVYGESKRFNTKPPLNKDGTVDNRLLSEKLADMRSFLSSVTSTKGGITAVYEKRAKTINEKFGTNYSWQDLADFYNSGDAEKLAKNFSSETVQKAIGLIQRSESKLKSKMEENKKITVTDQIVKDAALKILAKRGTAFYKSYTKEQRAEIRKLIKTME